MSIPKVIVLSGYGLNSEAETLFPFTQNGATGDIVHINDLISGDKQLADYQILAIPGGFSFGDDTGSGSAYAARLRNHLWEQILTFVQADKLVIGICNGAQILANLGLVPALDGKYGDRQIALKHNTTARYECRWVDVKVNPESNCVWTRNLYTLHIPVSHGEGNFFADAATTKQIQAKNLIALQYTHPDGTLAKGEFPYNPNGAMLDIAAMSDESGRILLTMPHPERAMLFTQRDDWTLLKEHYLREGKELPTVADGMAIFANAVSYFG